MGEADSLEEWDKMTVGLLPCPEELLTGDVLMLIDELDDSLYRNIDNQSMVDNLNINQLEGANIYFHDNIIFKITH